MTKARSKAAIIVKEETYKMPREQLPAPGQYDGHIKEFGSESNNITIGGKYKWVPDSNPAPGQYEPNAEVVKPRVKSAKIAPDSPSRNVGNNDPGPSPADTSFLTDWADQKGSFYIG